jgi:hypothetical protein
MDRRPPPTAFWVGALIAFRRTHRPEKVFALRPHENMHRADSFPAASPGVSRRHISLMRKTSAGPRARRMRPSFTRFSRHSRWACSAARGRRRKAGSARRAARPNSIGNGNGWCPGPILRRLDSYFSPEFSRKLPDAFRSGGGKVDFRLPAAVGSEGHWLVESEAGVEAARAELDRALQSSNQGAVGKAAVGKGAAGKPRSGSDERMARRRRDPL